MQVRQEIFSLQTPTKDQKKSMSGESGSQRIKVQELKHSPDKTLIWAQVYPTTLKQILKLQRKQYY